MTAAGISRLVGPSGSDSASVMTGPSSAPAVPPAPMKPNRRLPCSASNRSAMNDQNTAMANRLNTLTHTKKMRATMAEQALALLGVEQIGHERPEHRDGE